MIPNCSLASAVHLILYHTVLSSGLAHLTENSKLAPFARVLFDTKAVGVHSRSSNLFVLFNNFTLQVDNCLNVHIFSRWRGTVCAFLLGENTQQHEQHQLLAPSWFGFLYFPPTLTQTDYALAKSYGWGTSSVEEVASTGPGICFFQLYKPIIEIYVTTGLTCLPFSDERKGLVLRQLPLLWILPRLGRREADIKNRFVLPPHLTLKNFEGLDLGKMDKTDDSGLASYVTGQVDRSLSWKDVKWLQTITYLPILLKGVLTAEDARLAVEAGAAGIVVSNHGARQLDYAPATVMTLEEVVKAVQGRIPVFLDGGIRRGTDVFKALALGASGVFIGRPVVFSLAVDGEAGVRKVLQMLHDEFELTMALSGCCSIKEITRSHIMTPWDPPRITPRL
ncbi:hypothetical protein RND71_035436 [Anisodus tanguticus]|uniref:(S)-2-hydroxy-acid oxidase n=1 Tax=Anisodus tanguticus TaxID=243964 RepID=A0AAE1R4H6_9SOLA|nr:hypothetical protein RND71_035436 [Anisodus tanguticus]